MLRFSSQFWFIPVLYCTCWTTKVRMADEYLAVPLCAASNPPFSSVFFPFLSFPFLPVQEAIILRQFPSDNNHVVMPRPCGSPHPSFLDRDVAGPATMERNKLELRKRRKHLLASTSVMMLLVSPKIPSYLIAIALRRRANCECITAPQHLHSQVHLHKVLHPHPILHPSMNP